MKKGKSEVRIPNKVKYQGDTYKVTFFSWDDWDQDWKEETNRSYKPAAGSYQAVLEKITIAKGVRVSVKSGGCAGTALYCVFRHGFDG